MPLLPRAERYHHRTVNLGHRAQQILLAAVGGVLALFLVLPLGGLIAATSWSELVAGLSRPLSLRALELSAFTTSLSLLLVVVFGTPLAWTLARSSTRGARAIETVLQLPIVVPPAVAGIALLFAFGRRSAFAAWLLPSGVSLPFTTAAVVMAEVFVSAPFFLQAAISAFRRVDSNLLIVARSLGASPARVFARIAVPLARPGLLAGGLMSWARSLGEFGATLMFAGNLEGRTQTLPLAIYTALESDLRAAQAISLLLLGFACVLLLLVRVTERGAARP
jgi:molybdate transport system permease protein